VYFFTKTFLSQDSVSNTISSSSLKSLMQKAVKSSLSFKLGINSFMVFTKQSLMPSMTFTLSNAFDSSFWLMLTRFLIDSTIMKDE